MGLSRLAAYPFLGWAAVDVVVTGLALFPTFPIGKRRGTGAARRYFFGVLGAGALALAAILVWAVLSGQFAGVVQEFGWALLFELSMFAVLYFIAMGFPFLRYLQEPSREAEPTPSDEAKGSGRARTGSLAQGDAAGPQGREGGRRA